jgi:hypothetical protein
MHVNTMHCEKEIHIKVFIGKKLESIVEPMVHARLYELSAHEKQSHCLAIKWGR